MVGEAFAALSSFKAMMDIAKGLKDLSDETTRNRVAIELQEKILAAQAAQSNLIERNRQLENELASLKSWEADKERYQLQELPPGIFVRTLKSAMAHGEPTHRLCTQCYDGGKKSILQSLGTLHGQERLKCHGCGAVIKAGIYQPPPPGSAAPTWSTRRRG
jgi:hypothetical protein